jgi:hypothetical protein
MPTQSPTLQLVLFCMLTVLLCHQALMRWSYGLLRRRHDKLPVYFLFKRLIRRPALYMPLCGGGGQGLVRHDILDSGSSPAASQLSMARSCHSSASCATPLHRVSPKPSPSFPAATREHVADGGRSRRIQEKIGGSEKNRGHQG